MKNNTKNGLLCIIIGMGISIIASVILFFTEGAINIDFFSGLLFLIGIILMAIGRKEFGEKHQKFVIYAIIIFIITFIVTAIIIGILIFAMLSSIDVSDSAVNVDFSPIKNIFLIAPIAAVLGGITNILLVHELEDQKGKNILYIAFIVTLITSFYVAFIGMQIADEMIDDLDVIIDEIERDSGYYSTSEVTEKFEDKTVEFQRDLSKVGAIGLIGETLYLIAFIIPYNRIKSGELAPELPSYQKRCMTCGRVVPSDSVVCAYCGRRFDNM